MKLRALTAVLVLLTAAVAQQPAGPSPSAPPADTRGFTVTVKFSEKALAEMTRRGETVMVAAYLSGTPRKGALKKYVDEIGQVDLGEWRVEAKPGEPHVFQKIEMPAKAWAQTDGHDPEMLLNVFSGRRTDENNLLDCGIWQDGLTKLQGKTVELSCKLIGEK